MTQQPTSDSVVLETRDRVRYVTMNRPERRNALNEELQAALIEALYDAQGRSLTRRCAR